MPITTNPELTKEHIEYLENLRGSGRVNMWGAAPHLASALGLSINDAWSLLTQWMESHEPKPND